MVWWVFLPIFTAGLLLCHATQPFSATFSAISHQLNCSTTVVSAHFDIKGKYHMGTYTNWWRNTLALNACYVIYTNDISIARRMMKFRRTYPTVYVYASLDDFHLNLTSHFVPQITHVPTIAVASIWNEKVFFIARALESNYYQSEWFAWVDSGNGYARKNLLPTTPWPNEKVLLTLPQDQIIYTTSWFPWKYHSVAGTAYLYHKNIVGEVVKRYSEIFYKCINQPTWRCGSDQCLLSDMKAVSPNFFYQIGYGYGNLVPILFSPNVTNTNYTWTPTQSPTSSK